MGDDYAIVIGIDNYAKKDLDGFEPLTSAVADATHFMEWLRSAKGGDIQELPNEPRHIIPIFSPGTANNQLPSPMEAKPIKDEIDNALMEFGLNGEKRIGRRLYFYFSGHGIGVTSSDIAMMMANAIRTMESRNIGLTPYREYLRQRDLFEEVVFIADCCRNREKKPIEAGKPVFVNDPAANPNVQDVTILAAEYKELSFAVSGGKGLLTQALLEGLNGDPEATDQKGRVTSSTLGTFLPDRVQNLAKQNLLNQRPEIDLSPKKAEIVFSKTGKKVEIKVIAPAHVAGEIEVLDGQNNLIDKKDADLAREASPWLLELFDSAVPYTVLSPMARDTPLMLKLQNVKQKNNEFRLP